MDLSEAKTLNKELGNINLCILNALSHLEKQEWILAYKADQKAGSLLYDLHNKLSKQHPHEL
jgi:hypothetical protein